MTRWQTLNTVTFNRWRPQSGTQSVNVSIRLLDPGQSFCSSHLHEWAELLHRAAELCLMVGLGMAAMFGPTKRVVGHVSFLWDLTEAFPKNTDSVVGLRCRSGLTGTLWLQGKRQIRSFKRPHGKTNKQLWKEVQSITGRRAARSRPLWCLHSIITPVIHEGLFKDPSWSF